MVAVRAEQARLLKKAISSLSEKLRTAIVLHDIEGLSQEEVAEVLKVPVGTVKSRVSRARFELRNVLRKAMEEAI
jgi:RNA polymerase sigma-70 factor (ECF subfamily)